MVQTVFNVKRDARIVIGQTGDRTLSFNSELATLIAECISTWSTVEFELLRFYLNIFGGPETLVATAYLSLSTNGAKSGVIRSVAKKVLADDHYTLLDAILDVAKQRNRARDALAHRIWGYSPDIPDALLLADPTTLLALPATAKEVFVYRKEDFAQIISGNDEVADFVIRLGLTHQYRGTPDSEQLYRELCAEPPIRDKLNRQGAPKESPPKKASRPRRSSRA